MPLKAYGVLKGRPISRHLGSGANSHYQIHIVDDTLIIALRWMFPRSWRLPSFSFLWIQGSIIRSWPN